MKEEIVNIRKKRKKNKYINFFFISIRRFTRKKKKHTHASRWLVNADLHQERQPAIKVHGFHGESSPFKYYIPFLLLFKAISLKACTVNEYIWIISSIKSLMLWRIDDNEWYLWENLHFVTVNIYRLLIFISTFQHKKILQT